MSRIAKLLLVLVLLFAATPVAKAGEITKRKVCAQLCGSDLDCKICCKKQVGACRSPRGRRICSETRPARDEAAERYLARLCKVTALNFCQNGNRPICEAHCRDVARELLHRPAADPLHTLTERRALFCEGCSSAVEICQLQASPSGAFLQ